MERRGSSRRSRSSPIVRVSSMPSVKTNRTGLHAAHSTMSVESSSSGRSGVAYCFYPSSDHDTLVEVIKPAIVAFSLKIINLVHFRSHIDIRIIVNVYNVENVFFT